jgi:hypothetical protein
MQAIIAELLSLELPNVQSDSTAAKISSFIYEILYLSSGNRVVQSHSLQGYATAKLSIGRKGDIQINFLKHNAIAESSGDF